jgi:hypothetical protein
MPYPKSWSDKDLRMYRHIKASSGSKSIAAATVNKYKGKHKKKKRG